MRVKGGYIAIFIVFVLSACTGRGKILSENKMAHLYADFFLADQWLRDNSSLKPTADTTDFFAPVFRCESYECTAVGAEES